MNTLQIIKDLARIQKEVGSLQSQQFMLSQRIDALSPSQIRTYVQAAIIQAMAMSRAAIQASRNAADAESKIRYGLEEVVASAMAVNQEARKDPRPKRKPAARRKKRK